MTEPEARTSLLAHTEWVSKLALCLTGDPILAEEAVQDTWVYAMQHAPSRSPRGWLRQVLSNAIRQRRRADSRRLTRERRAAEERSDVLAPTSEVVERAESLNALVGAVLALAEPTRTTILLRFFDDLPPRDIATRMGVPVETVRTRVKRGLTSLRERLGPGHEAVIWNLVPVSFSLPGSSTVSLLARATLGILLMKKTAALLAVLLVAVLCLPLLSPHQEDITSSESKLERAVGIELEPHDLPSEPHVTRSAEREANSHENVDEPSAERNALATLTGRFVFADGTPAAGVELQLKGRLPRDLQSLVPGYQFGPDETFASDGEGRIEHTFLPGRSSWFRLRAQLAATVGLSWSWEAVTPGETIELGDVTLRAGGTIIGEVVDRDGFPLTSGWSIGAVLDEAAPDPSPVEAWTRAHPGGGATFRLENVPVGRCRLRGQLATNGPYARQVFLDVRPGETHRIRMQFPTVAARGEVRITIIDHPLHPKIQASSLRLVGAEGTVFEARKEGGQVSDYLFTGLPDRLYTLELDAPGHEPYRTFDVRPGPEPLIVRPHGSCAIDVTVVLAETGETPEDFHLELLDSRGRSCSNLAWLVRDDDDIGDGRFLLHDLVPGAYRVSIRLEAQPPTVVEVADLQRGETRAVTVAVQPACAIAGIVRDAFGTPAPAGTLVRLRPRAFDDLSPLERFDRSADRSKVPDRSTTTDERGAFRFDALGGGAYVLQAYHGPQDSVGLGTWSAKQGVELAAGDRREDVSLTLREGSYLVGRVVGVAEALLPRVRIRLAPDGKNVLEVGSSAYVHATVDATGSFRIGPLRAVTCHVFFQLCGDVPGGDEAELVHSVLLEHVDLPEAGDVERVYTIDDLHFGRLDVRVTLNGEPAVGCRVTALEPQSPTRRKMGIGVTDEGGHAQLWPVHAGHMGVLVQSDEWSYEAPMPIDLETGETRELSLSIERTHGVVRLLDARTQAPLTNQPIQWLLARPLTAGPLPRELWEGDLILEGTTDAYGDVSIACTTGTYVFQVRGEEIMAQVEFQWTRSGPERGVMMFTFEK